MNIQSQLARLGLFDARVPRYTSYPTAPHFAGGVDHNVFTRWIRAIPAGAHISLYIHVPFCRRLCWFCACRTQGTSQQAPVQAYVETLKAELAILKTHVSPDILLSRLHWGGGTPTLLSPDMISDLAQAIFDVIPLADGAEFSVEIDPDEVDAARLDALVAAGMNRVSIGVQDFDPDIQRCIGRIQPYDLTKNIADMIRARGIAGLNADILYGLPHQTKDKITATVNQLLTLSPDRVALYGYAHVPWMSRRQQMIPSDAIPAPGERLELFETAADIFVQNGYQHIGIDHFARPHDGLAKAAQDGRLRRNFQGYTDDQAPILVGLGASAISRLPQGYAQNAPATSDYTRAVRAGHFATQKGHIFADQDLWRARAIECLMCDFKVDAGELVQNYGVALHDVNAVFAAVAHQFGPMVQLRGDVLFIMPDGRPLTRMIARMFDAYDHTKAQHSSAV